MDTQNTLRRSLPAVFIGAVAIGACGDSALEPPPADPAEVGAVSLELIPGNLLVGGTASVAAGVANSGGSPSGPVGWQVLVGEAVIASGQLTGIAPGETERISHPSVGPFDAGDHTVRFEVEPAPGEGGDPSWLARQRGFNVFEPGFSIDLRIIGELTPDQEAEFLAAQERWERVIVGSLEPTHVHLAANECWADHPAVDEVVDDVLIIAMVGHFGDVTTAAAGPCVLREGNLLAAMGLVVFNIPGMQHFERLGLLQDLVAHEIGHVLGISTTVWEPKELLVGQGGPDPRFVGSHAQRAFRGMTGHTLGVPVPVENEGGPGTRDSHWRWRDFTGPQSSELMTALFRDENPLSALTIGALDDVGYAVDVNHAESYRLGSVAGSAAAGPVLDIGDDRLRGPLRVVSPDGRTRTVLDRR